MAPRWPVREDGKVWLHIGCGKINYPGFVNIDAQPWPHVHLVNDNLARLEAFADQTVDLVYMCHILEHLKRPEMKDVIGEMFRVLKPGGIFRLSVPDFDRLLEVYRASGGQIDTIHNQLMGGQDSPYNIHYTVCTAGSMQKLLAEVGFQTVRPWDPKQCKEFEAKDRSVRCLSAGRQEVCISLNLEAVK